MVEVNLSAVTVISSSPDSLVAEAAAVASVAAAPAEADVVQHEPASNAE
jgi:hypothetical protein